MANAKPIQLPSSPGNELDTLKVRFAIQQLGISHEQAAELQGYIKRHIEEEGGDVKGLPIELLIIGRFQREWDVWGKEPLEQTQSAIRKCVAALRKGVSLIQPITQRFSPPSSASRWKRRPEARTTRPRSSSGISNQSHPEVSDSQSPDDPFFWRGQDSPFMRPPGGAQPGRGGIDPRKMSTQQSCPSNLVELPGTPVVPQPTRRSDPGPPSHHSNDQLNIRIRPKSLSYGIPRHVRTPPPWARRDIHPPAPVCVGSEQQVSSHGSQSPPLIRPSGRHRTKRHHRRAASQTVPTKQDTPKQTGDTRKERLVENSVTKEFRGLRHQVLEVQEVPGGKTILVITEHSRRSSKLELVCDAEERNIPILGRERFLPSELEHPKPVLDNEFYPAPLNITRRGQANGKKPESAVTGVWELPQNEDNTTALLSTGREINGLAVGTLPPELYGSEPPTITTTTTTTTKQNIPLYTDTQLTISPLNIDGTSTSVSTQPLQNTFTPFQKPSPRRTASHRRAVTYPTPSNHPLSSSSNPSKIPNPYSSTPKSPPRRSHSVRHDKSLPPLPSPTPSSPSSEPPPHHPLPPLISPTQQLSAQPSPTTSTRSQTNPHHHPNNDSNHDHRQHYRREKQQYRQQQHHHHPKPDITAGSAGTVFPGGYLKLFSCLP